LGVTNLLRPTYTPNLSFVLDSTSHVKREGNSPPLLQSLTL